MPTGNDPQLNNKRRTRARAIVRAREPNCWICGNPIDMSLNAQTDPMGSTVDEVKARALGGSATDLTNLRHAHRLCNSRRGTASPTHDPAASSRAW